MANKKYNEFPAGTYDTSKIFLQADSSTGELEKVNLPAASNFSLNIVKVDFFASGSQDVTMLFSNTGNTVASETITGTGQGLFDLTNPVADDAKKVACLISVAQNNAVYIRSVTYTTTSNRVSYQIATLGTSTPVNANFSFIVVLITG